MATNQNKADNIANILKDPDQIKGVYLHTSEPLVWAILWHLLDHYGTTADGFADLVADIISKADELNHPTYTAGQIREVLACDYIKHTNELTLDQGVSIKTALEPALSLYARQVVASAYGFAPALIDPEKWADIFEGALIVGKYADGFGGASLYDYAVYLLENWDTCNDDDPNFREDVIRAFIDERGDLLGDYLNHLYGRDTNPDYLAAIRGGCLALYRLYKDEGEEGLTQ